MRKHLTTINRTLCVLMLCLLPTIGLAQNIDLAGPANQLRTSIEAAFPFVVGVLFLIVIFFNLGSFVGEGADWRKGAMRILIFAIAVGVIVALYRVVITQTL